MPADAEIDMPIEQEVVLRIDGGREYPYKLFGGRLDIPALAKQLAQDALRLSSLNGETPYCDGNGLSRAVFTTAMIKVETSRLKGDASSTPPFVYAQSYALQCCLTSLWQHGCSLALFCGLRVGFLLPARTAQMAPATLRFSVSDKGVNGCISVSTSICSCMN